MCRPPLIEILRYWSCYLHLKCCEREIKDEIFFCSCSTVFEEVPPCSETLDTLFTGACLRAIDSECLSNCLSSLSYRSRLIEVSTAQYLLALNCAR